MSIKGKKYKKIRSDIQNQLKWGFIKIPLSRVIILKNYYGKNKIIICIRPLFSSKILVVNKYRNKNGPSKIEYSTLDSKVNVYEYFKDMKSFKESSTC